MLDINSKAPDFSLFDQNEQNHSLAKYLGQWLIIYFYPKDDTPGCTQEACTIAEVYSDFAKLGVTVLGVSKDSIQSHKQFAEKYKLPFRLLSDEKGVMIEAYGAWKEKSLFGKTAMGTIRITYLINPEGLIAKVYPKVDPASHALEMLADLKQLQ